MSEVHGVGARDSAQEPAFLSIFHGEQLDVTVELRVDHGARVGPERVWRS